jgi:hypothetical protein
MRWKERPTNKNEFQHKQLRVFKTSLADAVNVKSLDDTGAQTPDAPELGSHPCPFCFELVPELH